MYMYIHVHDEMSLYVHSINTSVPFSDMYVPFCPILSRWVGFQMGGKEEGGKGELTGTTRSLSSNQHMLLDLSPSRRCRSPYWSWDNFGFKCCVAAAARCACVRANEGSWKCERIREGRAWEETKRRSNRD